jgi:hypothetical protein
MKQRKYYFFAQIRYSTPTVSRYPMEQEYQVFTATWLFRSINKKCARRWVKELLKYPAGDTEQQLVSLKRVTKREYKDIDSKAA